jgi:hypothetical protein
MNIIYKRKINKVKPINSDKSDSSIPEKSKSWRENMIRKEIKNVNSDPDNSYAKWLILKFFKIAKNNRLILERIEKLIVRFITP